MPFPPPHPHTPNPLTVPSICPQATLTPGPTQTLKQPSPQIQNRAYSPGHTLPWTQVGEFILSAKAHSCLFNCCNEKVSMKPNTRPPHRESRASWTQQAQRESKQKSVDLRAGTPWAEASRPPPLVCTGSRRQCARPTPTPEPVHP